MSPLTLVLLGVIACLVLFSGWLVYLLANRAVDRLLDGWEHPRPPLPAWLRYDWDNDLVLAHGRRYSACLFGRDGFLAPPGTLLRIEQGMDDVVTVTRVS